MDVSIDAKSLAAYGGGALGGWLLLKPLVTMGWSWLSSFVTKKLEGWKTAKVVQESPVPPQFLPVEAMEISGEEVVTTTADHLLDAAFVFQALSNQSGVDHCLNGIKELTAIANKPQVVQEVVN